jgi:hypothetical protein
MGGRPKEERRKKKEERRRKEQEQEQEQEQGWTLMASSFWDGLMAQNKWASSAVQLVSRDKVDGVFNRTAAFLSNRDTTNSAASIGDLRSESGVLP